ncbi:MAG: hypothetical protein FWD79_08825 [Desulfobulbus sp.]|nr:hypothetical protein [Desulfobulbus sp.]
MCFLVLYRCHASPKNTGLPPDEEMIAHFRAHREDFEELTQRWRKHPWVSHGHGIGYLFPIENADEMKRAGIKYISQTYRWYPDPYSIKTAQEDFYRIHNGDFTMYRNAKYCELKIVIEPEKKYRKMRMIYVQNDIRLFTVWKDFVNIPEIPRVENGFLLDPPQIVSPKVSPNAQYHENENVYTDQSRRRVLPSLNTIPEQWRVYECVYRQIEPQWFLRMCNGM